ncbi:SH3 domain-containing protein [Clostridium perfringens]|uniref:SH3 domain-containing protein n=1 Tax=Clostridium perfringens TaxID=1502 RepID=A0AAW9IHB9_CLOPF|nr:SH3 domain-containing protein [Clostridium perfringens]EIF6168351.1 SH3 domain-containing protein [Clostridium perfringens]MDH2459176.1 SH3 domain-containing protein [Clostridium perfringens]MDU2470565.1 SH3 domain-containing protein [Clostridium perfringens]MDZ5003263.1 SH3 domain-containing protein [Clostridium perfringens]MDZ5008974.1 SH3 domain-containing protein [Clostridium perfringens]
MKRKKLSIFILSAAIVTSSVSYGMTAKADEVKETKGYNYNVNLSEQKAVANNKISVKKVNGEILGYANPFTMLQILNMNGKTVEVITQSGLRGYVDANEFTLVESAVNDKLIEKNIEGHVTNVSTVLNLRKEPRIGAEIINRLLNNTKVNILGKQGSWYKIELNGQKGYVYGMFLNEGTMKENSSKTIANKKSEVKSEDKKEKKSSVKKEAKKEVVSGAKAKVAQKQREEAKANMTSQAKSAINKDAKSNNKVEVKSEVKKEAKNEVKTEMNSSTKVETNQVVTSEMVQAVNTEVKSEKNQETNLQVRPEIKSEEKTEMISKENLNVIPEAKKEEISEEIKPEINTEVESKPEMNKEVKAEEAKTEPEVKLEEKQEVKPVEASEEKVEPVKVEEKVEAKKEEVQDPKAKEMDELLKSEEYKFLRMSISYGERLVDRNDVYTKDSLKVLRTELAKAKKVFQDKDNLTMQLVEDTRYDLDKSIVDLVKLSDVKKPVKAKANVEVKKESNTEKKEEVKGEEGKTAPEVKLEEKQEVKPVEASEEKVEAKKEEVQDPKAKEMDELLKSEEYKFLRMSISYGERLVDRNDIYTKDSLKVLRTELAKAKKVFQDKDNLTMQLVEDTRYDLDKAIVDLVKLSDVKKPVKAKAKVEVKKESNTEKKEEVKAKEVKTAPEAKVEEKQEAKPVKNSEEKVETKKEVKEQPAKAEVMVPEVKENKEIKKDEPVKAKEVVKEKKSRVEEIEEILKSEDYRFLLMDISYGKRLANKFTVYTKDSIRNLNVSIEKAERAIGKKENLTLKLVQDTRDDVDRAIANLVKRNN